MFSANKTFQQYLKKESTGHFSFCIVKSQLSENKVNYFFFRLIGCKQCMLRRQNCNALSFSVSSTRSKFIIALLVFNHIFSFTGTIVLDYHESEDSKYWCFTVLFSLPQYCRPCQFLDRANTQERQGRYHIICNMRLILECQIMQVSRHHLTLNTIHQVGQVGAYSRRKFEINFLRLNSDFGKKITKFN